MCEKKRHRCAWINSPLSKNNKVLFTVLLPLITFQIHVHNSLKLFFFLFFQQNLKHLQMKGYLWLKGKLKMDMCILVFSNISVCELFGDKIQAILKYFYFLMRNGSKKQDDRIYSLFFTKKVIFRHLRTQKLSSIHSYIQNKYLFSLSANLTMRKK